MKLILSRHGETEENLAGILQGHLHGKLTKKGILQAKELSHNLKKENIDIIYSSDLDRASDTAKIILKERPNLELKLVRDLRERFLGEFQGKKKIDVGLTTKESLVKLNHPSIEQPKELYERAEKFINYLIKKHQHETVLCVSHNGITKAIISVLTNGKPEDIEGLEDIPNAGYLSFEVNKNKKTKKIIKTMEDNILMETQGWKVILADDQHYLGRSIIVTKRNVKSISELNKKEWEELHNLTITLEKTIKKVFGATYFNWECLMNSAFKEKKPKPHVHYHFKPRYRKPVMFAGEKFEDQEFGDHYNDKKEKLVSQKVFDKIKEEILKQLSS